MKTQPQNPVARNQTFTYLDRLDPEQVAQMRRPVQEMVRSHGWKLIEEILEKRLTELRVQMETGAHEHAEYTLYVGEIRGVQAVHGIIEAVIEGSERAANKLEQTARLQEANQ